MLKKLKIRNFRTHESLDLEFSPFVNVIWGLPGSGKTNILRAIEWGRTNKPKYESVVSKFAKGEETNVVFEFDNGTAEISKGPKSEKFVLNKRTSFSVTNRSVPEPIAQLINMSDVNVVNQLDPQFLITATPGDVGQTINRITKIEKIDGWIGKLTTLINTTNWKMQSEQAELETLEKELQVYDGIENIEKSISEYEKISAKAEECSNSLNHLEDLISNLSSLQKRIIKLQTLDESLITEFDQIGQTLSGIQKLDSSLLSLTKIQMRYTVVLRKNRNLDEILLEKENLIVAETLLKEINIREVAIKDINRYNGYDRKCVNLSAMLESKRIDYINGVRELGTCPLCQNKITEKHIKELENSL